MPRKASRRIRMLHHSPTRSRLRAMGQVMVSKLLRCMGQVPVTCIMQATIYSDHLHDASGFRRREMRSWGMRARADQLLVDRGLAENRARAQALILAGKVFSGERRIAKAGEPLAAEAPLEVRGQDHPWVSRGGL